MQFFSDPALQRAFGRRACADQSVVQATLNASTSTNVAQLMQALDVIFRQRSLALRHDFKSGLLILDADITGLPCGKKAEGSMKGHFSTAGIRYGRQMGRLLAAQYEEVVIKESKQGIGINKRSQKRFAAQQMVLLLGSLAHKLIVWSRRWLTAEAPRLAGYGAPRIVRDLFHTPGLLGFDPQGRLMRITLNRAAPLETISNQKVPTIDGCYDEPGFA